jgi:Calcineurin-like phosphoesterase/TIR domain
MSDETLFGWVHISDIHFGHGDASHRWDQELVMAALRRDLAGEPTPVRVDAIFVTGDIAFSGAGRSPNEYQQARKWLLEAGKAVGLGAERIFLVPGNHDVNRALDDKSRATGRLIKDLRSPPDNPATTLDDALKDAGDRKLLADRMGAYLEFARDFGPWVGSSAVPPPEERLFWVLPFPGHDGLSLRLVGLNTALLCKDDKDKGCLRLGNEQIQRALAGDPEPGEMIVILTHHPLRKGWLADEGRADAWIRNHAHAHLSGHVHDQEAEVARLGAGGSFVRVTAGAAHNEQLPAGIPETHGYNFGQVRRGEHGKVLLRVYPQIWSPQNASFLPQPCNRKGDLFVDYELGITLPAPAPGETRRGQGGLPGGEGPVVTPRVDVREVRKAPAPLPAGPLPTFISYAPADAKALERLEVHLKPLGPKRDKLIDAWSAAQVGAGEEARKVTAAHLHNARIILLLLSPDYLASDDCYDDEMMLSVARHDANEATVIPILLKPCDYANAPFAGLKFALQPHHEAPPAVVYARGADADNAFFLVAGEVRAAVERLRERAARR